MNKKKYLIVIALVIFIFLALFAFANPLNNKEEVNDNKEIEEKEEDVLKEEKEEDVLKEEKEQSVIVNNHGVTITNKPQIAIDNSYEKALEAVVKAEITLNAEALDTASKLVEIVKNETKKAELEERLVEVIEIIDLTDIIDVLVKNVKAAISKADMNSARNYVVVNKIPERLNSLSNELIKDLLIEKLETIADLVEDTKEPTINIEDEAILDSDTKITVTDDSEVTIKLNDEEIDNNTVVTDGKYTLIVTDTSFNTKEITFTVDTTVPEFVIKSTSISSGEYFSKLDMQVIDTNLVSVTINGTKFGAITPYNIDSTNYVIGENTLIATDIAGNESTYTFTLVETVNVLEENTILAQDEKLEIDEGKTYILDLNDNIYTVADTVNTRNIINKGTLIIKNGKMVNEFNGENFGLIDNYGTLIIDNVEFTDNGAGDGSTIKNRGGEVIVLNSKFINTGITDGNAGIYSDGKLTVENTTFESSSIRAYPLSVHSGEGTIKNIKVDGTHGALAINSGTVVVENFEYNADVHYGVYITNNGGLTGTDETDVTINGGTFNGNLYGLKAVVDDGNQDKADVTITINGGTFKGGKGAMSIAGKETTHNWDITINGGTFIGNIHNGNKTIDKWNLQINGGSFSSSVSTNLTSEYEETFNSETGYYEVNKKEV